MTSGTLFSSGSVSSKFLAKWAIARAENAEDAGGGGGGADNGGGDDDDDDDGQVVTTATRQAPNPMPTADFKS